MAQKASDEAEPEKFEDHSDSALIELINKKRAGQTISAPTKSRTSGNVIDLMDALRQSLAGSKRPAAAPATATKPKKGKKRIPEQKEMLLPISGKGGAAAATERKKADKPARSTARSRKTG